MPRDDRDGTARATHRATVQRGSDCAGAGPLWALLAQSAAAAAVRRRVSPWRIVGATAAAGWASLRRWTRALRRGQLWPALMRGLSLSGTLRKTAGKVAARLAALGAVAGPAWIAAFAGAARTQ